MFLFYIFVLISKVNEKFSDLAVCPLIVLSVFPDDC